MYPIRKTIVLPEVQVKTYLNKINRKIGKNYKCMEKLRKKMEKILKIP
jgi:hypothetical protein